MFYRLLKKYKYFCDSKRGTDPEIEFTPKTIWCYNPLSMKEGYVYILFNKRNGTLYTGVTSDLVGRVYQHKEKQASGFTQRYGVDKLGYYEICGDM